MLAYADHMEDVREMVQAGDGVVPAHRVAMRDLNPCFSDLFHTTSSRRPA